MTGWTTHANKPKDASHKLKPWMASYLKRLAPKAEWTLVQASNGKHYCTWTETLDHKGKAYATFKGGPHVSGVGAIGEAVRLRQACLKVDHDDE